MPPDKENYDFATHVLDKKYALYEWCEQKTNTLATVNSILLAAFFAIVGTRFSADTALRKIEFAGAVGFIGLSMAIVLWHIEPTMRSKTLPRGSKNLRSVVGTRNHASKDDYHESIRDADRERMLRDTTDQIYGMNKNVWRNQRAIRLAVITDMIGLVFFGIVVAQSSFTR